MRVSVYAVGRLRSGPEKTLIDDYKNRFDKSGRTLGLGPLTIQEVEDKKNIGKLAEAKLLQQAIPRGTNICGLDERGKMLTSIEFANHLAALRDQGVSNLGFVIGGADGLDEGLKKSFNHSFSFGKMVWPHMLVRAMLCEQLYRAASILAGTPYHRE
ncbi:MAG: 23S rRNA (pseudouridine(1915)-N(3))-methyltransferase RlmH [Paracoccaceae bacterium]